MPANHHSAKFFLRPKFRSAAHQALYLVGVKQIIELAQNVGAVRRYNRPISRINEHQQSHRQIFLYEETLRLFGRNIRLFGRGRKNFVIFAQSA